MPMFIRANSRPDAPALYDDARGDWLSYGELIGQYRGLEPAFGSGDRKLVFFFVRNSIAALTGILAAFEAGHVVALLNPALTSDATATLVDAYRPDLIFADPACEALSGTSALLASMKEASVVGLRCLRVDEGRGANLHPELCLLLSTSGTTGSPKFVRLSAENVRSNALAIAKVLGLTFRDRAFAHLPIHYSFGFSVVSSHLAAGASLVLTNDSLAAESAWRLFRQLQCTSLSGVPSHYEVLRRLDIDKLNIPSLECLTQAGGRLPPDVVRRFAEKMSARGGRFFVMYGQTEASPRMTTRLVDDKADMDKSVGPALPGTRLEIQDDSGAVLPADTVGNVVYHGPNVMMGYASCREDLDRGPELQDGLRTGDMGFLDSAGNLTLVGRVARFAKVHGLRISLDDVERLAGWQGPVAAVDGGDNRVIVVLENAHEQEVVTVRSRLSQSLSLHASAIVVRATSALPTKANGKIDYGKIRELK
jgi:acyl-CoA synthetase (AMP-forming)/AMP-acid ligase II